MRAQYKVNKVLPEKNINTLNDYPVISSATGVVAPIYTRNVSSVADLGPLSIVQPYPNSIHQEGGTVVRISRSAEDTDGVRIQIIRIR